MGSHSLTKQSALDTAGEGERTLIAEKVSWRRLGLETKEQGDRRLPAWGRFGSFGVPGSTLARCTSHSTDKKSCSSSHSSKGHVAAQITE